MFSEQSLCNCRTCGKRLTYDTLGAIFHYKWDDVGWAYCKDDIPSASINIDHVDLVGMTYNDATPSMTVDIDAFMSDGSSLPFRAIWTDIPGIKEVLEQVQGTVGKIVDLTGTNWTFDPGTGEISVDGTADIRNFTPSPLANTKFEKVLKDTTLVPMIRKTVKVGSINGAGTPTFDMDAGTMDLKVVADTNYPDSTVPTSKSRTFNVNIASALRKVNVDYINKDGDLAYDAATTTLTIPIKADTNWPGTATSKKVYLAFDIHEYFPPAPTPGDPAKVAYIQKNGTETFDDTTNVLSVPVKADTNAPATGTSLTATVTIDLTATIAAAMKKVKVDYIQKNGTATYDSTTETYTIPVKADTDHPDSGSAKTGTITQDVSDALKTVKVDYIQKNGDTSYTPATSTLTVPVKADTDHSGTGTAKNVDLAIDITDQLKTVKVNSSTIATNASQIALKPGSTKIIVVPVNADTDHPGTGTSGSNNLEIDISQWQGGDDYPKVDHVEYYPAKSVGHRDPDSGDQIPQLTNESTAFPVKLLGSSTNSKPYYTNTIYKIGYDSDTTKPKTGVTDKKDVLENVPISLPVAKVAWDTIHGQGWGQDPNDPDRASACSRHQNDSTVPTPIDTAVLGTDLENYAMTAMLVRTELEANVKQPYQFDLNDGYPDVKAATGNYAGVKGLSTHTSYACTGTSKEVNMKFGRMTVNVIDNNYWDNMWKMASGGLTVNTSTYIILDPIDPDNPHDVYISDEAADLYLANMNAKTRFAAGPYFDPAINVKNMHDDRDSVANAAVVSIRINALAADKAVINKLCPGDSTVAACPALDEIYLDGGLYPYHTNVDSVNTSVCNFTGAGFSTTDKVIGFKPWQPIFKIHMSVYAKTTYGLKCASYYTEFIKFFSFTSGGDRSAPTYPALWLSKKTGY